MIEQFKIVHEVDEESYRTAMRRLDTLEKKYDLLTAQLIRQANAQEKNTRKFAQTTTLEKQLTEEKNRLQKGINTLMESEVRLLKQLTALKKGSASHADTEKRLLRLQETRNKRQEEYNRLLRQTAVRQRAAADSNEPVFDQFVPGGGRRGGGRGGGSDLDQYASFVNSPWIKFGMAMSGVAATIFVAQQVIQSLAATIRPFTDLEKILIGLRQEFAFSNKELSEYEQNLRRIGAAGVMGFEDMTETLKNLKAEGYTTNEAFLILESRAADAEKAMAGTLTGTTTKFAGALRALSVEFGETFSNSIRRIVIGLTGAVRLTTAAIDKLGKFKEEYDDSTWGEIFRASMRNVPLAAPFFQEPLPEPKDEQQLTKPDSWLLRDAGQRISENRLHDRLYEEIEQSDQQYLKTIEKQKERQFRLKADAIRDEQRLLADAAKRELNQALKNNEEILNAKEKFNQAFLYKTDDLSSRMSTLIETRIKEEQAIINKRYNWEKDKLDIVNASDEKYANLEKARIEELRTVEEGYLKHFRELQQNRELAVRQAEDAIQNAIRQSSDRQARDYEAALRKIEQIHKRAAASIQQENERLFRLDYDKIRDQLRLQDKNNLDDLELTTKKAKTDPRAVLNVDALEDSFFKEFGSGFDDLISRAEKLVENRNKSRLDGLKHIFEENKRIVSGNQSALNALEKEYQINRQRIVEEGNRFIRELYDQHHAAELQARRSFNDEKLKLEEEAVRFEQRLPTIGMSDRQAQMYDSQLYLGQLRKNKNIKDKSGVDRMERVLMHPEYHAWLSEASDLWGNMEKAGVDALQNLTDKMTEFITTGKTGFSDLAASFGQMIAQILVESAMADLSGALFGTKGGEAGLFDGMFKGKDGGDGWLKKGFSAMLDWFAPAAHGNVFAGPGITAYENKIVDRPTVFPFAHGIGLMGEGTRPEAILPLMRIGKDLGVKAVLDREGNEAPRQQNIFHINVQTPDGNLSKQSVKQLKRGLLRSMSEANRRFN